VKDFVAWQADQAGDSCEVWVECKECREGWWLEVFRSYSNEQDVECENCNITWTEHIDPEDLRF